MLALTVKYLLSSVFAVGRSSVTETSPDRAKQIRDLQAREADANAREDCAAVVALSEQLVELVEKQTTDRLTNWEITNDKYFTYETFFGCAKASV